MGHGRNPAKGLSCGVLALLLLSWAHDANPQSNSASYSIVRQTADGGGGRTSSPTFGLEATLGQPDAGVAMASATYALRGGFHRPAEVGAGDVVFRNGFEP